MHTGPTQGSSTGGMESAGCLTTSGLEKKPMNQLDCTQIPSIRLKPGERCTKTLAASSDMSLVMGVGTLISEQKSRSQLLVFLGSAFLDSLVNREISGAEF